VGKTPRTDLGFRQATRREIRVTIRPRQGRGPTEKLARRHRRGGVLVRSFLFRVAKFNPGYSTALIGGWDTAHRIRNVTLENFRLNRRAANEPRDLDLYLREAEGVSFRR